jgi:hypothetical protein
VFFGNFWGINTGFDNTINYGCRGGRSLCYLYAYIYGGIHHVLNTMMRMRSNRMSTPVVTVDPRRKRVWDREKKYKIKH